MYVPRDAGDITLSDPESWGGLDSLIRSESVPELATRNHHASEQLPGHWDDLLNARLSEVVPLGHGQSSS